MATKYKLTQEIEYTDCQLKALLIKESDEALFILYDKYSAPLFGTILQLVNSALKAEDILMNTFLVAQQNPQSIKDCPFNLFIWLLRIAVKLCLKERNVDGSLISRENILAAFFPHRWPAIQQSRLEMLN